MIEFAHISDIHIAPPIIPKVKFLGKRLQSLIYWKKSRQYHHLPMINSSIKDSIITEKKLKALFVTGDLTNFGTLQELEKAKKWLDSFPIQKLCVPGNHDLLTLESYYFWKKCFPQDIPFYKRIDNIDIIGINSCIPTLPFCSYGYIFNSQLKNIEHILTTIKNDDTFKIILIHHPINFNLPWYKRLLNIKKIATLLRQNNINMVLHGHSHKATISNVYDSNIPLIGTSSSSLYKESPQMIASWNHIKINRFKNEWEVYLTRKDYNGKILNNISWSSSSFSEHSL